MTVAHLGQDRGVEGGRHLVAHLLVGGDDGRARLLDAETVRRLHAVGQHLGLGRQVGRRDDGHVADEQQLAVPLLVGGDVEDRQVRQHVAGRQQPLLLVQDQLHVLVGADQALHEHVGLAVAHHVARLRARPAHVRLVDDGEEARVDLVLAREALDAGAVADHDHLGDALARGHRGRLDGVGVLPRRHGHAAAGGAGRLERCRDLVERADGIHRSSSGRYRRASSLPCSTRSAPLASAAISFSPG